jgi:Bacteriophage lambda head decoration protein D
MALTQGYQPYEFLLSEATGNRSRDQAVATTVVGTPLPSGTVMGKVTASGKLIKYVDTATDGSQTAVAVLCTPMDGVAGDQRVTVINTDAEVFGAVLNGGVGIDANGKADLALLNIKVR